MLDRIIVNALYLVPLQVSKFNKQHPEEEVLIADGTKARKVNSDQEAQYEMGWATARRGVLMLTSQNLRCGDWVIPLSTIRQATLLQISGGSLLKISTIDDSHYQFGFQHNPAWENQTLFPLNIEKSALKFSAGSLVLRLLILVLIIYATVRIYFQSGFSFSVLFNLMFITWLISPLIRFLRLPKA